MHLSRQNGHLVLVAPSATARPQSALLARDRSAVAFFPPAAHAFQFYLAVPGATYADADALQRALASLYTWRAYGSAREAPAAADPAAAVEYQYAVGAEDETNIIIRIEPAPKPYPAHHVVANEVICSVSCAHHVILWTLLNSLVKRDGEAGRLYVGKTPISVRVVSPPPLYMARVPADIDDLILASFPVGSALRQVLLHGDACAPVARLVATDWAVPSQRCRGAAGAIGLPDDGVCLLENAPKLLVFKRWDVSFGIEAVRRGEAVATKRPFESVPGTQAAAAAAKRPRVVSPFEQSKYATFVRALSAGSLEALKVIYEPAHLVRWLEERAAARHKWDAPTLPDWPAQVRAYLLERTAELPDEYVAARQLGKALFE